jgi:hypothetical protein
MTRTPETIDGYFNQYGWTFQRIDDHNWRTGFRGDVASYTIRIRIWETGNSSWIYFTIVPFAVAPKKECWPRLYYYLLRANHEMNAAKFYVDPDNDVVLSVELPADSLDFSEFKRALDALSWYADEHYLAVLNLAQSPNAPSKYEQAPENKTPSGGTDSSSGLDWGEDSSGSGSGPEPSAPEGTPPAS